MKITKICIEIEKGKKVEISLEEAEKLYYELDRLFGVKMVPAPAVYPIITYPPLYYSPPTSIPDVWCGISTSGYITNNGIEQ